GAAGTPASAAGAPAPGAGADVPAVRGTGEALGRLYVLEGSTLGGKVLRRHLLACGADVPVAGLACFDPYGERAGRMWQELRAAVEAWARSAGTAGVLVAATSTFSALAGRCEADAALPAVPGAR
ncbi:hypothetical protein, partial [Aquipuribacter sp. SD81]|uniref:hypothetical protein n=1 Tax=Aquipuribacter sp. SD81 TaxID=3127703 RepID=UPI00301B47AC